MNETSKKARLWLRSYLAGEKCAACGETETKGLGVLCQSCSEKLNALAGVTCPRCRRPVRECGCVKENMRSSGTVGVAKLGFYVSSETDSPLYRVIWRLKSNRDRLLAEELASRLKPCVGTAAAGRGADFSAAFVTYVPRSGKKVKREGVDQAKLLAEALAESMGLCCLELIKRRKEGVSAQKKLAVGERAENVSGMFAPSGEFIPRGANVILVDDLITTGATVSECSRILKMSGAGMIICACLAEPF
ncbi:MAG: ComF family protein [Clostridia bacterium]|nr:ComF family protein [Clostridia bacterium]